MTKSKHPIMPDFSAISQTINDSTMNVIRENLIDMSETISKARGLGMSDNNIIEKTVSS